MTHPTIERLLQENMGLSIPTIGSSTIDRAVKRRQALCGCVTEEQYIASIESDAAELQHLIEDVVVPETWFFRDPESYTAFENWVSREWLPRNPADTLKILSVPCSTGEEPYSIAMALRSLGIPASRFRIDAVDISTVNLSAAATGRFGANSFRKYRLEFQQRYFTASGSEFQIDESIRAVVNFRQGNLLEPSWRGGADSYHVIFCRNLLIYFNEETQVKAMWQLDAGLAPGGLLFLGSAEMFIARMLHYKPFSHPMSFGYRKPVPGERKATHSITPLRTRSVSVARKVIPPIIAAAIPVQQPAPVKELTVKPDLEQDIAVARKLADSGNYAMARALCETLLVRNGASAECYFLLGLIADAEGDPKLARDLYRKALYVEPNHGEALTQMAALAKREGDPAHSARLLKRTDASAETTELPRARGTVR